MIEVTLFQQGTYYHGFSSEGHAEYAEGEDILCAAVSAVTQTASLAIADEVGEEYTAWEHGDGHLVFDVTPDTPEGVYIVHLLLKAMKIGLEAIQEQYPEYVSVIIQKDGR